jgi:hypothetical protein
MSLPDNKMTAKARDGINCFVDTPAGLCAAIEHFEQVCAAARLAEVPDHVWKWLIGSENSQNLSAPGLQRRL